MSKWLSRYTYALRLQIAKISIRERYLLLATLFSLVVLSSQGILYVTGMHTNKDVLSRIEAKKTQADKVQQLLSDYQKAVNNPGLIALQRDNEQLRNHIEKLKGNISKISERLMSPERMNNLLRGLLEQQEQLSLLTFEVMPVQKIESSIDNTSLFFKHSIKMNLEGRFEALEDYLQAIESASEFELFWDDLVINTENFPTLMIEVRVHTLSQNEEWLNV